MNPKLRDPRYLIPLAAALIVVVAGIAFGVACARTAEVVDEGELLPYVQGYSIYKVRVLDRYEFFVEPDYKPRRDAINSYVLVGIAFISLTFAVIIRVFPTSTASGAFRFFVCLFFGTNYLAADEFLGIHESLGHNMQFLTTLFPFAGHPDDVIIMLYGIPALLFVWWFRKTLVASKAAVLLFGAALGAFGLAAISDSLVLPIEELCEMTSSICLLAGVLTLGICHIDPASAVARRSEGYMKPDGTWQSAS